MLKMLRLDNNSMPTHNNYVLGGYLGEYFQEMDVIKIKNASS